MEELEKASKKYRDFRESCGYKDPVALNEIEEAYYAGAQWQKQQMIDRAVEWLKYYITYDDFGGNMEWLVPFENDECMIQHFKTYMEE